MYAPGGRFDRRLRRMGVGSYSTIVKPDNPAPFPPPPLAAVPRRLLSEGWLDVARVATSLDRRCLSETFSARSLCSFVLTWRARGRFGSEQVVVMQAGPGGNAPQGAPQGGQWVQEKYCGLITWLVGIFIFPCVCCCPCDDRLVSGWLCSPLHPPVGSTDRIFLFCNCSRICLVVVGGGGTDDF